VWGGRRETRIKVRREAEEGENKNKQNKEMKMECVRRKKRNEKES
jgi:hypothetical protein